jgi:AraC-like DNA-binding protein
VPSNSDSVAGFGETSASGADFGVHSRTLNRQFREHFGTTPLGLLVRMRVDRVAEQSEFGSYASLQYHFPARSARRHRSTDRAISRVDDASARARQPGLHGCKNFHYMTLSH